MYNKKLVNDLDKRRLFKTNKFHDDNTEEEYYWDDYDTTYGYKMNTEACCLPRKPVSIGERHIPKITNHPVNLHKGEKIKILLSYNIYKNTKSSQTSPEYYFPGPHHNFKPFFVNFKIAK